MSHVRRVRRAALRRALPVALPLAVLLGACTVGPQFHAPQADAPAQWHDPQQAASTPATASGASEASGVPVASVPTMDSDPDPRWWRSFEIGRAHV